MRRIRDWAISLVTVVVFASVLLLGDLLQRITFRMGMDRYESSLGLIQRMLIRTFGISGVSVDVEGRDRLADHGGYIFVSNHQSMFDIPIFGGILSDHSPRYVAKKSLARRIPTVSLYLRRGGNAVIDRHDKAQAVSAITEMGVLCQERDVAAVIFPEGTRSRDGTLGQYRAAGVETLMKAAPRLAVVPTAIDGSWRVFENNMLPIPYGTNVRVRFGEPIVRTPDEDAKAIVERCRAFTQATLDEWHTGQGPSH